MNKWQTLLAQPGPLMADGAMGTQLFAAGLQFGDPPETWNVLHPDVVRGIQRRYIEAGAQIVLTNTFGGSRFRLAMLNLQSRVSELNRTAAILLRAEVEASGRNVLVAGDIGPSGDILAPVGTLEYADAVAGFAEQAEALAAGGADVLWIETMSSLEEIQAAFEGVRRVAPEIPVITTMSFDTHGRTMMGVTPEQALQALTERGAAAVGANCGNGTDELLAAIQRMHAAGPRVPLVAKSNAGMPELVSGKAVYRATPDVMACYALDVYRAGARIIGACCGSSPDHIRAMAESLRSADLSAAPPPPAAPAGAPPAERPEAGAASDRAARRQARAARHAGDEGPRSE
ncbi:MAG: betaine--homocysteine S-methyltransferase [Anaerolineales bacterium]|nr:betaine--homocysteine S-methyltransferase [Anaerolineales bacterium]